MNARIFSQKKSHEKLCFNGSTFRDSSMGTKLNQLWKTDETVMSDQLLFMWSTFRDSRKGKK